MIFTPHVCLLNFQLLQCTLWNKNNVTSDVLIVILIFKILRHLISLNWLCLSHWEFKKHLRLMWILDILAGKIMRKLKILLEVDYNTNISTKIKSKGSFKNLDTACFMNSLTQGLDNFAWSLHSYRILTIYGRFLSLFTASVTHIWFNQNYRWNVVVNSPYLPSGQKAITFGQKTTPLDYNVEKSYHLAPYLVKTEMLAVLYNS